MTNHGKFKKKNKPKQKSELNKERRSDRKKNRKQKSMASPCMVNENKRQRDWGLTQKCMIMQHIAQQQEV